MKILSILLLTAVPLHASEAARIGDTVITTEELERAASTRLLQTRTDAYEARRDAIEKRAGEILVAQRAAAEHMKPEAWLAREVARRNPRVTEQEVAAARETLTGTNPDLARSMLEGRIQQIEQEIVGELRKTADIQVRLDPPRLEQRDFGGAPVHGPDDAPVTMVVFEDFQCPRCATLVDVFTMLRERFPEQLRILHRDFPLGMHKQAKAAAEAAACATEQDRFWEFSAALYAHQRSLDRATFEELAGETGVDRAALAECLDSGRQSRSWKDGLSAARELGLRGTPTVLINGRLITGARDYDTYARIIEEELTSPSARSAAASR